MLDECENEDAGGFMSDVHENEVADGVMSTEWKYEVVSTACAYEIPLPSYWS